MPASQRVRFDICFLFANFESHQIMEGKDYES